MPFIALPACQAFTAFYRHFNMSSTTMIPSKLSVSYQQDQGDRRDRHKEESHTCTQGLARDLPQWFELCESWRHPEQIFLTQPLKQCSISNYRKTRSSCRGRRLTRRHQRSAMCYHLIQPRLTCWRPSHRLKP